MIGYRPYGTGTQHTVSITKTVCDMIDSPDSSSVDDSSVDADAPPSFESESRANAAFAQLHDAFAHLPRDETDPLALGVARGLNRVLRLGLKEGASELLGADASCGSPGILLKDLAELYVRFLNEAWIRATGSATASGAGRAPEAESETEPVQVPMDTEH